MFAYRSDTAQPTLWAVFNEYIEARDLKPRTVRSYISILNCGLKDWLDMPVTAITKDMVVARHREISQRGKTAANLTMRVLKSLLCFASVQYEKDNVPLIPINPVQRLSDTKAWHKEVPRDRRIEPHQLAAWWTAVGNLNHDCHTDYLRFLLLTGMRRSEGANLLWEDVDLVGGFITARNTKNGSDHTIPTSSYLHDMLTNRKATASSPWVFPQRGSVGPIVGPEESIAKVTWAIGVKWSLHDLRRTFLDACVEVGLQDSFQKALLNHRGSDVTTMHYRKIPPHKLRVPLQAVTDYILKTAEQIS